MGLRGPAPKPNAVCVYEGNPGKRRLNQDEPQYPRILPEKPDDISRRAGRVWDELVNEMAAIDLLRRVDQRALWQLCEDEAILSEAYNGLWKMAAKLKQQAKAEGKDLAAGEIMTLLTMKAGRMAMATLRDLSARTIIERREFGLTPSSRSRLRSVGDAATSIDAIELKLCG